MDYVTGSYFGRYDKFKEMYRKLKINEDRDRLFILGDAIGYGPDSIKLLMELSYCSNVFLLMGKQEYLAKTLLPKIEKSDNVNDSILSLNDDDKQSFLQWVKIGGYEVANKFNALSSAGNDILESEREGILSYLDELEGYFELNVKGRKFVLAHSAPRNFDPAKPLDEYDAEDFALGETDYDIKYFPGKFFITSNTYTSLLNGGQFEKVYTNKKSHVSVATMEPSQGRASALCLDTLKYFYGSPLDIEEYVD